MVKFGYPDLIWILIQVKKIRKLKNVNTDWIFDYVKELGTDNDLSYLGALIFRYAY